jgi:tight adherence protein B
MTAVAIVCGLGVGLGALIIAAGWAGVLGGFRPEPVAKALPLRRMAAAVGAGVLVGAVTGWPMGAVLAGGFTWWAPALLGDRAGSRSSIARTEAIAAWAEMLRDTMAGAAGLEQALAATAAVAPPAIRAEVGALVAHLDREPLGAALRAFAEDLADPTGDLVVASFVLVAERQARRLGDLLSALAVAARAEASMRLRVEAGRGRTRTSVRVVVGTTAAMAVGLSMLNRGYLQPYDTATGQLVLGLVGGCFAAAFAWLARMARTQGPARLLAPVPGAQR